MNTQYQSGIAVLTVSLAMFIFARPVFLTFMSAKDFSTRRNAWLVLNTIGFLAPNFWFYAIPAAIVMLLAAKKDSNPIAFYLFLLLGMAPTSKELPTLGIVNTIITVDHMRLLSIFLLLPVILKNNAKPIGLNSNSKETLDALKSVRTIDLLIVGYGLLQVILLAPYTSLTDGMRRIVIFSIDILIPYFAISRTILNRSVVLEGLAAFALSTMMLAPLALVEIVLKTMLYGNFQNVWESSKIYIPLYRNDILRALVTTGNSINFGYLMTLGLLFWVGVMHRVKSELWRWTVLGFIATGLVASFSRGPWLGAILGLLFLLFLSPLGSKRISQILLFAALAACVALLSPIGEKIIDMMPFVGTVEDENVVYRQRLLEISISLILANPFTGNPFFLQYMEEMRQGQGIIDLVNALATIALSYGLIGLGLFLGANLTVAWKVFRLRKSESVDARWMAAAIVSSIVTTIVILLTTASWLSMNYAIWAMIALGALLVVEMQLGRFTLTVENGTIDEKPTPTGRQRRAMSRAI